MQYSLTTRFKILFSKNKAPVLVNLVLPSFIKNDHHVGQKLKLVSAFESLYRKFSLTEKLELRVLRQCRCLASHYF